MKGISMHERKEKGLSHLIQALRAVQTAFNVEANLVRPGAVLHGISIVEGNLLQPMTRGAYNPRVPDLSQKEIDAITTGKRFAIICEDYRQSAQVVEELHNPSVVLSTAGGPDQPDETRRSALAKALYEISMVNPTVEFDLVFHNGICGGCKHYTTAKP
jgi:hypothetical protein